MRKLTIILALACAFLASCNGKKDFDKNIRESYRYAVLTAAASQMTVSLTQTVWHNAIYDHEDSHGNYVSDFNEALQRLHKELDSNGALDSISRYRNTMDSLAGELASPPSDRKEMYDDYIKLVSEVNTLYQMAENPKGSLTNYSANAMQQAVTVRKLDDAFRLKYSKILESGGSTKK